MKEPDTEAARAQRRRGRWIAVVGVLLGVAAGVAYLATHGGGRASGGAWAPAPDQWDKTWTVRYAGGSLRYVGDYRADPAAPRGRRPVGRHYVYRPGLVFNVPVPRDAPAALAAVREELDFETDPVPGRAFALGDDWEPAIPPTAPKVPPGLTGQWFLYQDDGSRALRYVGHFADGKEEGVVAMWADDGTLFENTMSAGRKQGLARTFSPEGKRLVEGRFDGDRREGVWSVYRADGSLAGTETYVGGLLSGPAKQYGPDGRVTVEETYRNGQRDGLMSVYRADGTLDSQAMYGEGVQTGPLARYHPNGTVALRVDMKAGVPHGWMERFDESGASLGRVFMVDGVEKDNAPDWVTPETTSRRLPAAEGAPAPAAPMPGAGAPETEPKVAAASLSPSAEPSAGASGDIPGDVPGKASDEAPPPSSSAESAAETGTETAPR